MVLHYLKEKLNHAKICPQGAEITSLAYHLERDTKSQKIIDKLCEALSSISISILASEQEQYWSLPDTPTTTTTHHHPPH